MRAAPAGAVPYSLLDFIPPTPAVLQGPDLMIRAGRVLLNPPVRCNLWLHIGDTGCLAQAFSLPLKFIFTTWLPRTMRKSIKGYDCGTWVHTCCFQMLAGQPGSGQARSSGRRNKNEGIVRGGSDLPRE